MNITLREFTSIPESPLEIEQRLKKRYLDRLALRVRKLRRLLIDHDWNELRSQCGQIAVSGDSFGFSEISHLAAQARLILPEAKVGRASAPAEAKAAVENLIFFIDQFLMENLSIRE